MFYLYNIDLVLIISALTLIFLMQPIGASKKVIKKLEERVTEAKGKLCEDPARAFETKLVFSEEWDRVNALSRS